MPKTLKVWDNTTMDAKLEQIGTAIAQSLNGDKIIPRKLMREIAEAFGPSAMDAEKAFLETWNRKTREQSSGGKAARDPNHPLVITRGFAETQPEEELSRYLPEEKILINKDLFRAKLKGVDFSALDAARERQILDDLRNDSIGLSKDDVALYYNLIKINALSHTTMVKSQAQEKANVNWPDTILKLVENEFPLDPTATGKLNGGHPLERATILNVLTDAIKTNRIQPKILAAFLGNKNPKFVTKLKSYLSMTVNERDGNQNEIMTYFALYLTLSGTPAATLEAMNLSSPLLAFLTEKIGRVRTIYYVSMVFGFAFHYVLFAQIYEISAKYRQASEDQKPKLQKLYQGEERLNMLINNAVGVASRRIANWKVEGREVLGNMKRYLSLNKDLVTGTDLFKTDYE